MDLWEGVYPLLIAVPFFHCSLNYSILDPSSVHIKEFGVLFRTKIEAVPEYFWSRHARRKQHIKAIYRVSPEPI